MTTGILIDAVELRSGWRAPEVELEPGTVAAVIGPSGGDRAALLRSVAGLERPTAGRVLLDGRPVTPDAVGTVDEDHVLLGGLTAAENVLTRVLARRSPMPADWDAAVALLAAVGLPESSWHNLAEQLSGGQQQRVAIARALADGPAVLCLDDPTSELDGASAELVWTRISSAASAGAIVLVGLPQLDPPAHADVVIRTAAA